MAKNYAWTSQNFIHNERLIQSSEVKIIVEIISKIILPLSQSSDTEDHVKFCLLALEKLSKNKDNIDILLEYRQNVSLIDVACQCLDSKNDEINVAALRFLAEVFSVSDKAVKQCMYNNVMDKLGTLTMNAQVVTI